MAFFSAFAIYFIIWWVTLFAILPIGVKTQAEHGDVTLGTTESAPMAAQLGKKVLLTTVVSAIIYAIYYVLTGVLGLSVDSIPRIVPEFS
jgi:predicted secreted protein